MQSSSAHWQTLRFVRSLPRLFAGWIAIGLVLVNVFPLAAQEAAPEKKRIEPRLPILDSPPRVLQGMTTLPDALYLRDEGGEPIFIPQVRYAEFERYLKERSGLGEADFPKAILESAEIQGIVKEGYAELSIAFSMSVTDPSLSWVKLPLAMSNLNWVGKPITTGGKSSFVAISPEDGGLNWWVEPDGSPKYTLALQAVAKIETTVAESSLHFELPESVVQLKLEIPGQHHRVQWRGAPGEVIQSEVIDRTTHATVRGRGGVGTFIWRDQVASRELGAVEVDSSTRVIRSADGKGWRCMTRLRIVADNRLGPRELMIRLPEGAAWDPSMVNGPSSSWTLDLAKPLAKSEPDEPAKEESEERRPLRLHLQLSDRARSAVEEIPIEWSLPQEDIASGSFAFSGMEVEEVQRHEGRISIVVPTTTRYSWLSSSDYSLVKQTPASDIADAIEYDFKFNRQPVRLQALISQDEVQDRWRPDYLVTFEKDAIRLQGVLTFPTDPSQMVGLRVIGGAWRFDSAVWDKTGELITTEIVEGNTLRFHASSLIPPTGPSDDSALTLNAPVAIRFSAYQTIPVGELRNLQFQLPQISMLVDGKRRTERGNGVLVVNRGSWQLDGPMTRTNGMARTSESPNSLRMLLSELTDTELIMYRFQNSGPEARWSGRLRRTSTNASTSMQTQLSITREGWSVERRWSVRTSGPLLETLAVRVPTSWMTYDREAERWVVPARLKMTADGIPLELVATSEAGEGGVLVRPAKNDWSDFFELNLSYRHAMPMLPDEPANGGEGTDRTSKEGNRSIAIQLPRLVIEPSVRIIEHRSTLEAGLGLLCKMDQAAAKPVWVAHLDRQVAFSMSDTSDEVEVEVKSWSLAAESEVDVHRIWLQSVMNGEQRRERCVVRLSTDQPSLRFQLPSRWSVESTSVMVNQRKESIEPDVESGLFRVVLPRSETPPPTAVSLLQSSDRNPPRLPSGEWVVEFWNWSTLDDRWTRMVQADLPSIVGSRGQSPFTWQVVLPSDQHLWTSSTSLLSDQRWVWRNLGWRRQSPRTQETIESEMGASQQPSIPSQTNQYVFISSGSMAKGESHQIGTLRIVPRFLLWLPVATVVLLLTALWPRMGVLHHPWLLLAVAVVLMLLAMVAPDMAIMLIQAAFASLLIVALVTTLRWASKQRLNRRSVFVNRPVPAFVARPTVRPIDDSVETQPRSEVSGDKSAPSTRTLDGIPSVPITETR